VPSREQFVGTAAHIADEIDRYIQADACDGFILVPHLTPHGLDDFVDQGVPLLQERGAYRTEYSGDTLREHLAGSRPRFSRLGTPVATRPIPAASPTSVAADAHGQRGRAAACRRRAPPDAP